MPGSGFGESLGRGPGPNMVAAAPCHNTEADVAMKGSCLAREGRACGYYENAPGAPRLVYPRRHSFCHGGAASGRWLSLWWVSLRVMRHSPEAFGQLVCRLETGVALGPLAVAPIGVRSTSPARSTAEHAERAEFLRRVPEHVPSLLFFSACSACSAVDLMPGSNRIGSPLARTTTKMHKVPNDRPTRADTLSVIAVRQAAAGLLRGEPSHPRQRWPEGVSEDRPEPR
jgi:hypothetical protein